MGQYIREGKSFQFNYIHMVDSKVYNSSHTRFHFNHSVYVNSNPLNLLFTYSVNTLSTIWDPAESLVNYSFFSVITFKIPFFIELNDKDYNHLINKQNKIPRRPLFMRHLVIRALFPISRNFPLFPYMFIFYVDNFHFSKQKFHVV